MAECSSFSRSIDVYLSPSIGSNGSPVRLSQVPGAGGAGAAAFRAVAEENR